MMSTILSRSTFTTNRALEFFSEKELQMQIGHGKRLWPIALVKELIDNALDACEAVGVAPEIEITVEPNVVSIRDNGPGLPEGTLRRSLDYMIRVSDKAYYASPTRGQLGNALKCVWAAPFVAQGNSSARVDVVTGGNWYTIQVGLDRIAQAPEIQLTVSPDGIVKSGTLIKIHWSGIAGYIVPGENSYSYNGPFITDLVREYALFNPHAAFRLVDTDGSHFVPATDPGWRKWRPGEPTSPHWYNVERLRGLIAAYLNNEKNGAKARTVREFVSEFNGLSGTAKQKAVTEAAGLSSAYLHDLVEDGDVRIHQVGRLLYQMQEAARPVKPAALGVLGESHMAARMAAGYYVETDSIQYRKAEGEADGVPFVLEVAFGVYTDAFRGFGSTTVMGLNWSPALEIPTGDLWQALNDVRVDRSDPVAFVVHLSCPRLEYRDRGKGTLALQPEIREALWSSARLVAKQWVQAKRQADREGRVRERDMEKMRKAKQRKVLSIKEAAYQVMERAYMQVSDNGRLPANARQLMYAARPMVLELTGGRVWSDSSQFTQGFLPDFIDTDYPDVAASWDVVFDSRGKLMEPHTDERVDIGTLSVRRYIAGWSDGAAGGISIEDLPTGYRTSGPANRYKFVLFVEKEGFNELLAAARIAPKYDIAIMSTKGMSVTACRRLVEELSLRGVTVLVMHDFDKSGFSIVHTLRSDTRRYQFKTPPNVVDLGLRLGDVEAMGLQSEHVVYDGKVDPKLNLAQSGATPKECLSLVRGQRDGQWSGERVELNAMGSAQLIGWLEEKLVAAGVKKVIPSQAVLEDAYRNAVRIGMVQKSLDVARALVYAVDIPIPDHLATRVEKRIVGSLQPWDDIVANIANVDAMQLGLMDDKKGGIDEIR